MIYKLLFIIFIMVIIHCKVVYSSLPQDEYYYSDEPIKKYHCCARYEKKISVGHGVSGEIITIDAGHCRKVCPKHTIDDPGDASRPAVQRCPAQSICHPRGSRLERVSTLQGVKIIETVDTCDCWSSQSKCNRVSFEQLVHSGTPYQATIDVGYCHGTCSKSLNCKPLKNTTISIKGPDGDEVYQVIKKCGCASKCHRMDRTESVLDYSQLEIKKGINTTDVKPVVRNINVGQCVGNTGSCLGNKTETCLLRDKKNPTICVASLYTKQHSCTPARFKIHEYRNRRGFKREIIQIVECACI
ncbi:hypothetical protein HCN44_007517 [Aphidius gifuensis]|uniref:Uncharacterized protein n=1 Tax=Aphidius gifuensis TaxID=684658 RepID=A0A835CND5_APHGI|nr:uncharacterized protein LOC122859374 [Aphidius gifuensis]KAF7988023.1 hypothetical protein HCN44_007517 [Aphidius gifuensis]